uniref:Uncharacterized protein n=1 Tax=Nothobranchius furzeri TaxID=105023 RepID=A0A1A8U1E4_NOTFU
MSQEDGGRKRWRGRMCVKLVNKQRRWMSLLKEQLIQAIRKQNEGVRERGYIQWVNGSKYRLKRRKRPTQMIINAPWGITGIYGEDYRPSFVFLFVSHLHS